VVKARLIPGSLVDAVARAVAARPWGTLEDPRLLHGDFHPRHVYADRSRVTAIIDWGDATAGDPDYDIARVLHSTLLRSDMPTAVELALRASSPHRGEIDGRRLATLLTYAAVFILWSMHGEYESGAPWPPWWPVQTRALERVLSALGDTT
jgi:aminoglycoside phosphotransferase (APT) family kinase protein